VKGIETAIVFYDLIGANSFDSNLGVERFPIGGAHVPAVQLNVTSGPVTFQTPEWDGLGRQRATLDDYVQASAASCVLQDDVSVQVVKPNAALSPPITVPVSLQTVTLPGTSSIFHPFSFPLPNAALGNQLIVTISVGSADTCEQNITGAEVKY
jgi:hypothetical protein